ncbi:hypothetical protein R83H12_02788 [Fibrobacteria bacterium R8-3-H12]
MNLADAIKAAIKTCLSKNILVYFLREHASEIENMIYGEWNWDDAIAVAKEEEREEILDLIEKGYTSADIKEFLQQKTHSKNF